MGYESFYDDDNHKFEMCKYKPYIRIGSKRCKNCTYNKGHLFLNGWSHYCLCDYKNKRLMPLEGVMNRITRVEVIDKNGRAYHNWNTNNDIKTSLQDEGRTLKVFIQEKENEVTE